jgi:hypothetical protein
MQLATEALQQVLPKCLCEIVLSFVPRLAFEWLTSLQPCSERVTAVGLCSNKLFLGLITGVISIFDPLNGRHLASFPGRYQITDLVDCGDLLASTSSQGEVRIWDLAERKMVNEWDYRVKNPDIKLAVLRNGDLACYVFGYNEKAYINIAARADVFHTTLVRINPLIVAEAILATSRCTLLVANSKTIMEYCGRSGGLLNVVSLGPYAHRSFGQVSLLNLTPTRVASVVNGLVDIWQLENGNLTKLLHIGTLDVGRLMVCSSRCLVIAKKHSGLEEVLEDVKTHILEIYSQRLVEICQKPSFVPKFDHMIALPNNRLVTGGAETRSFHIWTMSLH